MLSSGLAFAVDDSSIQNNVSTVLLIEWRGKRRLLFVGDAEWHRGVSRDGKKNGSWNVMWNQRKELLNEADRLPQGRSPRQPQRDAVESAKPVTSDEVNQISQCHPAAAGRRVRNRRLKCVVSTKRKQYDTIPDAELLTELGRRVKNTKVYLTELEQQSDDFDPDEDIFNYSVMKTYSKEPSPRQVGEKGFLDQPQPWRTDMESKGRGAEKMIGEVEFVDVLIDAGS